MSERTLTEELQSVLRAHSLDAPAPSASIAAILAETVQLPGGGNSGSNSGPGRRLAGARARLRAANKTSFVAASVLVAIVLLAFGVRSLGSGSSDKASSSSAAGTALSAGSAGASAASGGDKNAPSFNGTNGSASASAVFPGPQLAAPESQAASTALPDAGCASGETAISSPVATVPYAPAGSASSLPVVQLDCVAANGTPLGSDVSVYRSTATSSVRVAQLIRASQGIAVDSVEVVGGSELTVVGEQGGATFTYSFTISADRTTYTQTSAQRLTAACTSADVQVTAAPTADSGQAGRAGVLRVVNRSTTFCNLTGYPRIAAVPAPAASAGKIVYTLRGVLGGVSSPTYSTIRLAPGDAATALVEAGTTSRCAVSTALQVAIAAGQPAQTVPFAISTCALDVHPYVSGTTGND